jgi:Ser/Thr protein kinase RdoA (MazF antagonist)
VPSMSDRLFKSPAVFPHDWPDIAGKFEAYCNRNSRFLGGMPNVTFKAWRGEEALAIRVCNIAYTSRRHLDAEVAVLLFLESVQFGKSPSLTAGFDGRYVQDWRQHPVIAMAYIEGTPVEGPPFSESLLVSVGRTVGELTSALKSFPLKLGEEETYRARSERLLSRMGPVVMAIDWHVNMDFLWNIWRQESGILLGDISVSQLQVAHTDVWPPNLIRTMSGVSLIDFDDLALATPMLDIASAVAEFVVDDDGHASEANAEAMLYGFVQSGCSLPTDSVEQLVAGVLCSYVSWLSIDATHGMPFERSQHYYKRLKHLARPENRTQFRTQLARAAVRAISSL